MTRIALCLTGQPRCVKQGYEFVKRNILDGNDVTVFCHVWESPEAADVVECYTPEVLMVEKAINPDLSKYTRFPPPAPNWKVKNPVLSTYAQLYAIEKCNELKTIYEEQNNFKFDWVIRSLYDFAINIKIPFDELDMMSENWKQKGLVGENLVYCNVNHPFPPGQYNGTWHSLVREDFEQWLR